MFDFEKLEVYKKIRETNKLIYPKLIKLADEDPDLSFQIRESLLKVILNLVEGTGKYSSEEKKKHYSMSRSSLFETVALYQLALDQGMVTKEDYDFFYDRFEQISKMMLGMIRTKPVYDKGYDQKEDTFLDD